MKQINKLKGYENIKDNYYVDEYGNIYNTKTNRKLKLYAKTGGYLYAALSGKNNEKYYKRVHRIVATAYCENKENKIYVNHKDENRQNNFYKNLEWVTPKENNLWSLAKKVYCYKNNKLVKVYNYSREVIDDGFNQGHVCAVARGEETHHKGYIFSYKPI